MSSYWILVLVVVVGVPVGYGLNRAIVDRPRERAGEIRPRRATFLFVATIWAAIAVFVVLAASYPRLWWAWLLILLVLGYAAIAVAILRRRRHLLPKDSKSDTAAP
jgi:amino acid transporter